MNRIELIFIVNDMRYSARLVIDPDPKHREELKGDFLDIVASEAGAFWDDAVLLGLIDEVI